MQSEARFKYKGKELGVIVLCPLALKFVLYHWWYTCLLITWIDHFARLNYSILWGRVMHVCKESSVAFWKQWMHWEASVTCYAKRILEILMLINLEVMFFVTLQPMAMEQVLSDRDSEDEVDDDVADLEDRRVCSLSEQYLCLLLRIFSLWTGSFWGSICFGLKVLLCVNRQKPEE